MNSTHLSACACFLLLSGGACAQDFNKLNNLFRDAARITEAVKGVLPPATVPVPAPAPAAPPSVATTTPVPSPSPSSIPPPASPAPTPSATSPAPLQTAVIPAVTKPPATVSARDESRQAILATCGIASNGTATCDPLFTPPQALMRLAAGDRQAKFYDIEQAIVANPYLPLEPVVLNNHARIGHENFPGFFTGISGLSCKPDGSLLVSANAAFDVTQNVDKRYPYAKGHWEVAPDGAIKALNVQRDGGRTEALAPTRLDFVSHGSQHRATWARAIAEGVGEAVEDRHGNVWAVGSCTLRKFSPDGATHTILEPDKACPGNNYPDFMSPKKVAYDAVRDEVVLGTDIWGSGEGTSGIWRINQAHQITEVIRSWYKGKPSAPAANVMPGKIISLIDVLAVDPQGRIWFGATFESTSRTKRTRALYRIDASPKNLVPLVRSDIEEDQFPVDGSLQSKSLSGRRNLRGGCFDAQGNGYFIGGQNELVRKYEAATQRMVTWLH